MYNVIYKMMFLYHFILVLLGNESKYSDILGWHSTDELPSKPDQELFLPPCLTVVV